jgi:hypothetical protein
MTKLFIALFAAFATLAVVSPSSAQSPKPFVDRTGSKLDACPAGFDQLLPNCSVGLVVTTDGQIKACHCKLDNLKLPDSVDEVIPVERQRVDYRSELQIGKIGDTSDPRDPCGWIKINGVQRWVCW